MKEPLKCWYCGREETPWFHWKKEVTIDRHHVKHKPYPIIIFLCRECHDRLHKENFRKGGKGSINEERNPYFLFVLDGKMSPEEARIKREELIKNNSCLI